MALSSRHCQICFALRPSCGEEAPALRLCAACDAELTALRLGQPVSTLGGYQVTSLYRYSGLYRRLLLRAKVQGDQRTARLLINQAVQLPQLAVMAAWADATVACPSSLWGRMRGRLDVAALFCERISHVYGVPSLPAPAHLFWRLKKRARMAGRVGPVRGLNSDADDAKSPLPARRSLEAWACAAHGKGLGARILVVDDIATTGHTLMQVAGCLVAAGDLGPAPARERSLRLLTLAAAYRPTPLHCT